MRLVSTLPMSYLSSARMLEGLMHHMAANAVHLKEHGLQDLVL